MRATQVFLVIFAFLQTTFAVKSELFKKCEQSGFCNRNRHYASKISENTKNYYTIDQSSLQFGESIISGDIHKALNGSFVRLPFEIEILTNNNLRLKVDEDRSAIKWDNKLLKKERYADSWKYAFTGEPIKSTKYEIKELSNGKFGIIYGEKSQYEAEVDTETFQILVKYNGETQIVLNDRSFFNVEHFRSEENNLENLYPEESDFNSFRDEFKDSKDDSLPFGPESIALDVTLQGFKYVYGIPEHADTLSLKDTSESEPYRLYNVDIFEYETNSRLPMYGSIPLLVAHKPGLSTGIFWVNGADTYVDIKKEKKEVDGVLSTSSSTKTHWMSENGIVDVVILIAETPAEITKNYAGLTGTTGLPQLFSLGYHQCRWNYNDEADVLSITENMDKYEIPYDVIWLDVEYTDSKKYFTWKTELFPDPERMMNKLDETGRTLVTIIDPHFKTDYSVSDEMRSKSLVFTNKNGDDYKGHCWPGESVWIDTFNPKSVEHLTYLYRNGTSFAGDATNLHIWNDMNEPSVFSGPETSSPKDVINYGNVEIRSDHNIYGLTYHEATYEALKERYVNKRPFILTRAYYSGSQRSTAMWTGDNMSKWEYLKISIPMILTQNVVGMPFSGADVGGFFGNPSKELLTRWYQAGIWYPFFRAHAHIDARRREPWVPGEPYTSYIRDAVRIRYQLLPLFYTKFYETSINGSTILTPLFFKYPDSEEVFEIEDEFFLDGLLVKPVTEEGADSTTIYLPDDKVYYDFETYEPLQGKGNHEVSAPLNKIPAFFRSGSITPKQERYRRSSKLMKYDPYTLVIAVDEEGSASGNLYIDDGETFDYEKGEYLYLSFELNDREITSTVISGNLEVNNKVEKIIILGLKDVESATVTQENSWNANIDVKDTHIIIKNPGVKLGKQWSIKI